MLHIRDRIDEKLFRQKYCIDRLNGVEMATYFKVSRKTISRLLKLYGIHERNISETRKLTKWGPSEQQKKNIATAARKMYGANHPSWRGGEYIDDWGYRRIRVDRQYVKEHRYVMEQHLGRKLLHSEEVHHIDHDKLNNAIDNLQIMSASEHATLHWSDLTKRQNQSDKIREIRSKKFWSTKPK